MIRIQSKSGRRFSLLRKNLRKKKIKKIVVIEGGEFRPVLAF